MMRLVLALIFSALVCADPAAAQDSDGDGVQDTGDNCVDLANPLQEDTNDDGFGNACDPDWTNDGIVGGPDYILMSIHHGHQNQDSTDLDLSVDGSGIVGGPSFILLSQLYGGAPGPSGYGPDLDTDGWVDTGFDNCSEASNSNQADTNGDGIGNACDADWTNDGVVDAYDYNLLLFHNGHDNLDAVDLDLSVDGSGLVGSSSFILVSLQYGGPPGPTGLGGDADADGWAGQGFDNCPDAYNSDQEDSNGDGVGNRCDDDFEPIASEPPDTTVYPAARFLTDAGGNLHLLYVARPHPSTGRPVDIRWLREEGGAWVTDTVWTNTVNLNPVRSFAADLNADGEICVFWTVIEGAHRNRYGCIDENGVMQSQLMPNFSFGGGDNANLAHDTNGNPHVISYIHGLYNDSNTRLNHYLRHTMFDGSAWTPLVNLPTLEESGDPETGNYEFRILVDEATGKLHVVHFYYDGSFSADLNMGCNDRGDLAVSTWDPATGGFGDLHVALEGVDPGLRGKQLRGMDAWTDAAGQVHVAYAVQPAGNCEEGPENDPVFRVFYATGPLLGTWQVTLLEERPDDQFSLALSELVTDASGTLRVASHSSWDDPENLHEFSISGGAVSQTPIDVDVLSSAGILRSTSRGASQLPLYLFSLYEADGSSTFVVREPPAP